MSKAKHVNAIKVTDAEASLITQALFAAAKFTWDENWDLLVKVCEQLQKKSEK